MAPAFLASVVTDPARASTAQQDALYQEVAKTYDEALGRLARAYEADSEKRRDLLQEIHVALWRSFASFDGRCSTRTWVYRVAHNVAATHVDGARRSRQRDWVSLDELALVPSDSDDDTRVERKLALERLLALVEGLAPLERQVILLYLEGFDAASIAEVTGISAGNVATKMSRIKTILATQFGERRTP